MRLIGSRNSRVTVVAAALCVGLLMMSLSAQRPQRGNQTPAQPAANQSPAKPSGNQSPEKPAEPPKPPDITKFVTSKDGTKIAYDVTGSGPGLMLVHGGGQTRQDWHTRDYVKRLSVAFTVITVDARGHGGSDKPTKPEAYAVDRLIEDFLVVADAAGVKQFEVWAYSTGATVSRYLCTKTDRARAMIYGGVPFGPALDGPMRAAVMGLRTKWGPIFEAQAAGRLDPKTLTEGDRETLRVGTLAISLAQLTAMLDYPPVEPADMKCPTLWVVGTANTDAMASVKAYEGKLTGTPVTLALSEGLPLPDEFTRIDAVFPKALEFLMKHRAGS